MTCHLLPREAVRPPPAAPSRWRSAVKACGITRRTLRARVAATLRGRLDRPSSTTRATSALVLCKLRRQSFASCSFCACCDGCCAVSVCVRCTPRRMRQSSRRLFRAKALPHAESMRMARVLAVSSPTAAERGHRVAHRHAPSEKSTLLPRQSWNLSCGVDSVTNLYLCCTSVSTQLPLSTTFTPRCTCVMRVATSDRRSPRPVAVRQFIEPTAAW